MPRRGTRGPAAELDEPVEETGAGAEERESDAGSGSAAGSAADADAGAAVADEEDESEVESEQEAEQDAAWADLVEADVPNAAPDHHFALRQSDAGMAEAAQAAMDQPDQPLPPAHIACRVRCSHFLSLRNSQAQ